MKKYNFNYIDRARKLLGLGEEATISEIRDSYYKLSKEYHPDRYKGKDREGNQEKFKEITSAYNVLMEYIHSFRVSFRKKDVERMSMDKLTYKHLNQFYDGWWGKLDI